MNPSEISVRSYGKSSSNFTAPRYRKIDISQTSQIPSAPSAEIWRRGESRYQQSTYPLERPKIPTGSQVPCPFNYISPWHTIFASVWCIGQRLSRLRIDLSTDRKVGLKEARPPGKRRLSNTLILCNPTRGMKRWNYSRDGVPQLLVIFLIFCREGDFRWPLNTCTSLRLGSLALTCSFLYPCALSASSILIDNLLRDPFAATAEPDLGLIHNMRQIFPADSPLIPIVEEFIGIGLTANRRIRPTPLPQIPEQSTSALFQQPNTQVQWPQFDVQDPNFLSLEMQSAYGQGYSLNPSVSPAAQYQAETSSAASTFSVPQFSGISPHLTYPFQQTENPAYTSLASVPPTPFIPQPPSPAKSSSHRRTQSRPEISSTSQWIGPGSPSRRQQQSTRPHSPIRIHHPIPIHAPPPPNQPQVTIPQQTPQSWDPNAAPLWLPETVQQEQQPTARSPQRPGHRKNPSKSQPRGGHK